MSDPAFPKNLEGRVLRWQSKPKREPSYLSITLSVILYTAFVVAWTIFCLKGVSL